MATLWGLLFLCPVLSLVSGQGVANESKCTYTFTVPLEYFESQCMTHELQSNLQEIRRENKQITDDNAELKEKIETLSKEYGDMVETVKRLEKETTNWRQVVEWPSYDTPQGPEDIKDIQDDKNTYEDCYKAIRKGSGKEGIYRLKPRNALLDFLAYCDTEGWTTLLRRFNGNVDFYRGWSDYSGGFGEVNGEYWIGLEKMHMMTNSKKYQLSLEALGWNDKLYHSEHDFFAVDNERTGYQLSIGNMTSGNQDDEMYQLNGLKFSTKHRDNDEWSHGNCAEHYRGGWWLKSCGFDPNRQWCNGEGCMSWGDTRIRKIQLKIRPMAVKGTNIAKTTKPANLKPPRAKAAKPNKVKKPKQTKPKKKGKQPKPTPTSFF